MSSSGKGRLQGGSLGWLALSALVVVADQLTKWVVVTSLAYGERINVLPFFSWVRWHNDGAAFSMLAGSGGWQRWFFVALALGFTVFIVYELRRLQVTERYMAFVYALILGGALGNMVDRLLQGYVVDFILVHYGEWYFPAFNVADIALSCGAGLWIGFLVVSGIRERNAAHRKQAAQSNKAHSSNAHSSNAHSSNAHSNKEAPP